MLKAYKNKGISLIELMVAVALGLTLILSMLAFYSVSSQNVVDFQKANHDQQQIRKMMNLLETDIENTGGFECAATDEIFKNNILPRAIISLGIGEDTDPHKLSYKQIVFVHPIISEYQHTALGMFEYQTDSSTTPISLTTLTTYTPLQITDAGCGQDKSSIHVGTTVLEMLPMNNIITTDTQYSNSKKASNVNAFVALSAAQSRRDGTQNIPINTYTPNMNDATVMFLSDESGKSEISSGNNKVDIFLGFAPEKSNDPNITRPTHVPNRDMDSLDQGGWINPFESKTNFDLLTNNTDKQKYLNATDARKLNEILHKNSKDGNKNIETYPLSPPAINQIRAIKFVFTFGAHGDVPERKLTRVIRFKNTHLMKLD